MKLVKVVCIGVIRQRAEESEGNRLKSQTSRSTLTLEPSLVMSGLTLFRNLGRLPSSSAWTEGYH